MTFKTKFLGSMAAAAALMSSGQALALVGDPCGPLTTLTPIPEYTLSFQVCGSNLVGSVSALATGWVAFGFGRDELMPETDVFMAGVSSAGASYFQDAFAFVRSPPVRDAIQNVSLIGATESGGTTSYSFSRPLTTGDTVGDFDLTDGSYFVLMAYHATNDSLTARHTWRDASEMAFTFAPVPEPESVLMLLAGLGLVARRLQQRR